MAEERRKTYIRLDPVLYERIEQAAKRARRSVNAEMEFRLEESVRNDGAFTVAYTSGGVLGGEVR